MRALALLLGLALCGPGFAGEIEIRSGLLAMPDGAKLSARYFLPKDAGRVPVLLELLPYRKDDEFYARDYSLCEYFARNGFAVARVDVRGTGGSGGRLPDREYSDVELRDAERIIARLSRMPWSNGNVGMYGISWSGFNSLMLAQRKPRGLRAVLAVDATDDLFHDDVHFQDGIFHVDEYSLEIDHENGLPRSPDYALDAAYFRDRFDREPWIFTYKEHQRPGPFWDRKSLLRLGPVRVPAFLIGGLYDGYRDSVTRLLQSSGDVPVKALIGPWNHNWPDNPDWGPSYEWRTEALRWWRQWLLGENTGILREPNFTVFVRHSHKPDRNLKEIPGAWRAESFPLAGATELPFALTAEHALVPPAQARGGEAAHELAYRPGAGLELGYWWGELTPDMAPVDASSLNYDTAPLGEDVEIVGRPRLQLRDARATAPLAHWVARLEDVHPDGAVSLVTGGALNGAEAAGPTEGEPRAVKPGEPQALRLDLHFTTWRFPKGHRIRLALSNTAFPMLWPTPSAMTATIRPGAATLSLPRVPDASGPPPALGAVEPRRELPGYAVDDAKAWTMVPTLAKDAPAGIVKTFDTGEETKKIPGHGVKSGETTSWWVNERDPAKAGFTGTIYHEFSGKSEFRLDSRMEVTSDARDFHIFFRRTLSRAGKKIREKTWEKKIPRDFQ